MSNCHPTPTHWVRVGLLRWRREVRLCAVHGSTWAGDCTYAAVRPRSTVTL